MPIFFFPHSWGLPVLRSCLRQALEEQREKRRIRGCLCVHPSPRVTSATGTRTECKSINGAGREKKKKPKNPQAVHFQGGSVGWMEAAEHDLMPQEKKKNQQAPTSAPRQPEYWTRGPWVIVLSSLRGWKGYIRHSPAANGTWHLFKWKSARNFFLMARHKSFKL